MIRLSEDTEPQAPAWMTLNFSLYTILLTFFICLFSKGILKKEQFSFQEGSRSVKVSLFAPEKRTVLSNSAAGSVIAVPSIIDDNALLSDVPGIVAERTPYGMRVNVRNDLLFAPGIPILYQAADNLLKNFITFSQNGQYTIGIEVYSDAGTNKENALALAYRRAIATARYWEAHGRIASERIYPSGHVSYGRVEQDGSSDKEAVSGQTAIKFYYKQ